MIFVVFNAFGNNFNPIQFVEKFSLEGFSCFEKGEHMSFGDKIHDQSGLAFSFESSKNFDDAKEMINFFLLKNSEWLLALAEEPVIRSFNIGVTVGGESFSPCLDFEFNFIELFCKFKLEMNISCYPVND